MFYANLKFESELVIGGRAEYNSNQIMLLTLTKYQLQKQTKIVYTEKRVLFYLLGGFNSCVCMRESRLSVF